MNKEAVERKEQFLEPGEPEREGEEAAALETMKRFTGRREEWPEIRWDIWKLVVEEDSKVNLLLKDKEEGVMRICFGW